MARKIRHKGIELPTDGVGLPGYFIYIYLILARMILQARTPPNIVYVGPLPTLVVVALSRTFPADPRIGNSCDRTLFCALSHLITSANTFFDRSLTPVF